jgi:hypothetical protein
VEQKGAANENCFQGIGWSAERCSHHVTLAPGTDGDDLKGEQ